MSASSAAILTDDRDRVDLDAFLEQMAATPFVDGKSDCVLTVADWVMVATGCSDPAAEFRGRYRTVLERERLLRRHGGIASVISDGARRARLRTATNPVRGDVGLVRLNGQELAAICLGRHWAIKSSRGVVVGLAEVLIAWSVPHG